VIVVGAALVRDGRVLAAQRSHPPALAGQWELPGGKVEAGEDERAALVRESREELGLAITVGEPLCADVPTVGVEGVLRTFVCTAEGEPEPAEHRAVRWLAADELTTVRWLDSDLALLPALERLLLGSAP
jgi:8-oxo-dGTP diphosphatase